MSPTIEEFELIEAVCLPTTAVRLRHLTSANASVMLESLAVRPVKTASGREMAMPGSSDVREKRALDPDSRRWLESLGSTHPGREQAISRLHELLLRAARWEVGRRRASLDQLSDPELDEIALQSADDALVALLSKLEQYRGASRFTTWAYKFALLEAAVKVRRRIWQNREIPVEPEHWLTIRDEGAGPDGTAESSELLDALREAISSALTPHQREVLVSVALKGVPIDVLAERFGATRGALYKTLHDARQKLRSELATSGLALDEDRQKK